MPSTHRFLLVVFPAQGHLNPALHLANRLIRLGAAHVTFSTTIHMHHRMSNKPSIPSLSFLPFSDGYDHGYTPSPNDPPTLYVSQYERRGSDFVTNLILSSSQEGRPFTCLIYTLLNPWAGKAARALHLPSAMLWVQPATMLDILYYYFHSYNHYIKDKITEEPSSCSLELPGLPLMAPARDLPSFLFDSSSSVDSFMISMFEEQFRELDMEVKPRILVNTFEALEAEAWSAVDELNVIPIGPLVQPALLDGGEEFSGSGNVFEGSSDCVEWLDSKTEESVVYVSFGSFSVLRKKQREEIGRALLDRGCPFLWVIRENEKKGEEEDEEEVRWREELEEKGGKIVKWCCQVEVLSHASLGCFVTHCGWNSTLESLVSGVPVVAFPQWTDQKTNAKLIEDVWKTGVRVDYNEEGVVEAAEIRRCLDLVMGSGERGGELRRNTQKWKGVAREVAKEGGSLEKNLRNFVDDVAQVSLRFG